MIPEILGWLLIVGAFLVVVALGTAVFMLIHLTYNQSLELIAERRGER